MSEDARVELIADIGAVLGEGPQWVARDSALWWVDIKGQEIFRWSDGALDRWETPLRIGSLLPRASGGFIAGTDQGIAAIDPLENRFDILFNPEADRRTNRFNDGKVDRQGHLWVGSMDDEENQASGAFYRIGPDLACVRVDDGYRVTNGPAFSPDGTTVYVNDSARQKTFSCALREDGSLTAKSVLKQWGEGDGYPDGMTVDSEGCLWIAFWDGWCVRRVSPEGEVLRTVRLPVARPTSPAFGGAGLDQLFVTSASIGLCRGEIAEQPGAGGTFLCAVGVTGLAERPFAG
jgi:sugar lactone lactonase YvrE